MKLIYLDIFCACPQNDLLYTIPRGRQRLEERVWWSADDMEENMKALISSLDRVHPVNLLDWDP